MTTVLVCGGRDYVDVESLRMVLDSIHASGVTGPITTLVQGGARGADRLAKDWARQQNVHCITVEPDYKRYGSTQAPIMRNKAMLELPGYPIDLVVAFSGGRGTARMIEFAQDAGVPISIIAP